MAAPGCSTCCGSSSRAPLAGAASGASTAQSGPYWCIDHDHEHVVVAPLTAAGHAAETQSTAPTVERERKYLVADLPELPSRGNALRQGYLTAGAPSVRVREADGQHCTLTIKAGRGAVRTEVELPLAREQFDALWPFTQARRIEKTRYRMPLGDRTAELDVFSGSLAGLELVEVEFDDDEQMAAFEPPAWFGRDVTDDDRFTNASLALAGDPRVGGQAE